MIQGYCIGGGLGVALCCDLRFAAANARFAIRAARLGLGYAYGGIKRLVDVVGPAFAKEIFCTARQFTVEEAVAMGLINRIFPTAELSAAVNDASMRIGQNAPVCTENPIRVY
jgi:enoyl-CoA hydratase/carnithine racemase